MKTLIFAFVLLISTVACTKQASTTVETTTDSIENVDSVLVDTTVVDSL